MNHRLPPRFARQKSSLSNAFTTLELLVAVGIVAVLIAILYPIGGSLSAASRSTKCLANLRQISTFMNIYLANHQQTYPYSYHENEDGTARTFWPTELVKAANLNDYKAFICPATTELHPYLNQNSSAGAAYVSYAINRYAVSPSYADRFQRAKASSITNPHEVLLLVDFDSGNQPGDGWYSAAQSQVRSEYNANSQLTRRHQGKLNALFCDGHVSSLTKSELLNSGAAAAPWFYGVFSQP